MSGRSTRARCPRDVRLQAGLTNQFLIERRGAFDWKCCRERKTFSQSTSPRPSPQRGEGEDFEFIYVTTTGNCDIITAAHMLAMKDQAIVCNIGHFDNEIQVDQLKKTKGLRIENIKPQYDRYWLPGGKKIIYMLAEGERGRPGCGA